MSANPLMPLPAGPEALTGAPATSRFTPVDPLRLLRQHTRLLIVTAIIGVVLGVGIYVALRLLSPGYTTYAQLVVNPPPGNPWSVTPEAGAMQTDAISSYIQNQVVLLKSNDIIDSALKDPVLRQTAWFRSFGGAVPKRPANYDSLSDAAKAKIDSSIAAAEGARISDVREYLQRHALNASPIRGSTLIQVSLTGRDPSDLPTVLDIILDSYFSRLQQDKDSSNADLRATYFAEEKRAEEDLSNISARQKQYVIENDIPNLQSQLNDAQISYQTVAQREAELRVLKQQAADAYQSLVAAQQQGTLAPSATDVAMAEHDPALAQRDEKLRQLREEREVALHRFGENHYYVKDLDRRIIAAEQERKIEFDRLLAQQMQVTISQAKSQVDSYEAQLQGLQPTLDQARLRMRDLSLKIKGYDDLVEQYKAAQDRRDQAQKMVQDVRILGSRTDSTRVSRQQNPIRAELTFPPKPYITVPGVTLLTLFLVGAFIYLREMLDQRIKSPSDVKLLPNVELLGVLPETTDDPSSPARVESVVQDDPAGLMAESFRQLRTALLTQMDRRGYKTLGVASPQPECGTSSVASNLAMSLAYIGRKVLLLDANLRRPNQHYIFGLAQQPGLVEVLRGTASAEAVIFHKVEPNVDILPAGDVRDVPPEMLEGAAFRGLISQLERTYDLIIIDCPPALLASDCQMLAKHVDAFLLVLRAMEDKRSMVGRMLRQFEGLRADVLGAVLNRARHAAGGYFKETYTEFYRYRNGDGRKTPAKPKSPEPAKTEA